MNFGAIVSTSELRLALARLGARRLLPCCIVGGYWELALLSRAAVGFWLASTPHMHDMRATNVTSLTPTHFYQLCQHLFVRQHGNTNNLTLCTQQSKQNALLSFGACVASSTRATTSTTSTTTTVVVVS